MRPRGAVRSAFHPGIDVAADARSLNFRYGDGVFGPVPERRRLDAVRASLLDPDCDGPDPAYGIAMDVGLVQHRDELERRYLLFGVVAFSSGLMGREPVRTQGHVHARAPHSGWSPPELFEVWEGRAIVYAQERSGWDPGRCFAVIAEPGDHVIVPPGWPHFVVNADPSCCMVFAALCDRQYAFEYEAVRARRGLAWFPVCDAKDLSWQANRAYCAPTLRVGYARAYAEFGVRQRIPLYEQFATDPAALQWVSEPQLMTEHWSTFSPIGETLQGY